MTFQLDTSGLVLVRAEGLASSHPHAGSNISWSNLSPFTQGYVEALFASTEHPGFLDVEPGNDDAGHKRVAFSDLAPDTLARIIADCEVIAERTGWTRLDTTTGALAWRLRQEATAFYGLTPLTVQLGDDGKVRFA